MIVVKFVKFGPVVSEEKIFVKDYKNLRKIGKFDYKGQKLLEGSTDNLVMLTYL